MLVASGACSCTDHSDWSMAHTGRVTLTDIDSKMGVTGTVFQDELAWLAFCWSQCGLVVAFVG